MEEFLHTQEYGLLVKNSNIILRLLKLPKPLSCLKNQTPQ